jgi:hypothetical protein
MEWVRVECPAGREVSARALFRIGLFRRRQNMLSERRTYRGFRPSALGLPSLEEFKTLRLLKRARIEAYADRVRSGLPVFEEDEAAMGLPVARAGRAR